MPDKRAYRKWSDKDMDKALEAISQGMSLGKASKEFGIPKQTLSDRKTGKSSGQVGRPTEMTREEETSLVNYIQYMASIASPLSVSHIKLLAWDIVKKRKPDCRFNDLSGPGHTWWDGFKKRHNKKLTLRKPDNVDRSRQRMANSTVMKQHSSLLKETMEKLDILDKPERVFNCDESGISLDMKSGKVVVSRNTKQAYSQSKGSREHITAHVAVSASGFLIPPFLIFEKAYPSGPYAKNGPDNALYGISPNGYMDGELFRMWVEKLFIAQTKHIPRPLLLILDGHGSHLDVDMIDLMIENDIHLFCLPPHTTNILQPLDVAIFGPFKTHFSKLTDLVTLATLGNKKPISLSKRNFTGVFKEAFEETLSLSIIKKGFRKCGIFPFNPDAIDKNRLMGGNNDVRLSKDVESLSADSRLETSAESSNNDNSEVIPAENNNLEPTDISNTTSQENSSIPTGAQPIDSSSAIHRSLPGGANISFNIENVASSSTPADKYRSNPLLRAIPESLRSSLIFPASPEKKVQNLRIITKARVLTSEEQVSMFRQKINEKREKEAAKEARKKKREEAKALKQKQKEEKEKKKEANRKKKEQSKKNFNIDEPFEQQPEEPSTSTEVSTRPSRKRKRPVKYWSSSESETEEEESESEEEEEDEFDPETHCFACKSEDAPKHKRKKNKENNWISCDACHYWFHDVCEKLKGKDIDTDEYICRSCRL